LRPGGGVDRTVLVSDLSRRIPGQWGSRHTPYAARRVLSWRFPGLGRPVESDAYSFTFTVEMGDGTPRAGFPFADCVGDELLRYIGDPARPLQRTCNRGIPGPHRGKPARRVRLPTRPTMTGDHNTPITADRDWTWSRSPRTQLGAPDTHGRAHRGGHMALARPKGWI